MVNIKRLNGLALQSVCWMYGSICLLSQIHYVDNQISCTSLPQSISSRPTLQPFIILLSARAFHQDNWKNCPHNWLKPAGLALSGAFKPFFFLNVHCFFIYPFTLRKRTPDLRTRQRTAGKQRDCLPFICISSFPWLKWTASFVPQETWYSLHHPLNPSSDPKPTGRSPGLTFQRSFWKSSVLGNKIHPEMHWGVMRPSRVWDLNTPTRHWNVEILRPVRHARKSQGNEDMWGRLNLKPKAPLGCRRKVTRGKACLGDQLHALSFSTPLPCFAMLF